MSKGKVTPCKNCGHTDFVRDRISVAGDLSCTQCGTVQEENSIVLEVQFGESSSGAAVVQGAMVGADQARASYGGRQNSMESREQTIAKGRSRIKRIAMALRIPDYISDSACEWFKLALTQNFVQGRRSQNVVATCLYVACRKEKTHHMLIDFSSILQIPVYSLGATFLKMVKALCITQLPLADPSIFIQHFAEKLDFKDKCTKVVRDAVKLSQRMSSDWIHDGRRPAGIAGACILLAARMNNFRRSHAEIVAVAHVAEETLQRRLNEFKKTKSGELSIASFRNSSGTELSNPPSFDKNRRTEQRLKERLAKKQEALRRYMSNENGDQEAAQGTQSSLEEAPSAAEREPESSPMLTPNLRRSKRNGGAQVARDISADHDLDKPTDSQAQQESSSKTGTGEEAEEELGKETNGQAEQAAGDQAEKERETHTQDETGKDASETSLLSKSKTLLKKMPTYNKLSEERDKDLILSRILGGCLLSQQEISDAITQIMNRTEKKIQSAMYATPGDGKDEVAERIDLNKPRNLCKLDPSSVYLKRVLSDTELNLDDDDEIVMELQLLESERAIKERIWTGLNQDFLIEQEKRRLKQEADELTGNTSAKAPRKKRAKTSPERTEIDPLGDAVAAAGLDELTGEPLSAADSLKKYFSKKAFSKKINYTTLGDLFESTATVLGGNP